jgi:hypothetical protein
MGTWSSMMKTMHLTTGQIKEAHNFFGRRSSLAATETLGAFVVAL